MMKLCAASRDKGFRLGGEVRLLMIAAPGGGKGTQGERLATRSSGQHGMPRGGQRRRIDCGRA